MFLWSLENICKATSIEPGAHQINTSFRATFISKTIRPPLSILLELKMNPFSFHTTPNFRSNHSCSKHLHTFLYVINFYANIWHPLLEFKFLKTKDLTFVSYNVYRWFYEAHHTNLRSEKNFNTPKYFICSSWFLTHLRKLLLKHEAELLWLYLYLLQQGCLI